MMLETITLEVTADVLKEADRRRHNYKTLHSSRCPIALAARNAGIVDPIVGPGEMYGTWHNERCVFPLPRHGRLLVYYWDSGLTVVPASIIVAGVPLVKR